jgi:hypothetical protein
MFEVAQLTTSKLSANETRPVQSPFTTAVGRKMYLPKRAGEPPFAPPQYYYAASKSGVVPSLLMAAASNIDNGSDIQHDAA